MKEILHRASIRKWQERMVEDEKITEILRAAMAAPSAMNERPWEFYVIKKKEVLEALSKTTPYSGLVARAPVAIVVVYNKERSMPEYNSIDCALAVENILLEIDSQGLGGVMIGVCPNEEKMHYIEKVLQLPETQRAFTIIPFGYPLEPKEQPDRLEESKIHYV